MKSRNDSDLNAPESRERRTAMKKIAVGAGALAGISSLPDKWTKPIVGSIVLPAHAQTSANLMLCPDLTLTLLNGTQSSSTVSVRVQGCITPATGGITVQLAVQGSQTAAVAAGIPRQAEGLFAQALSAAGDLLISEAIAAECSEINGSAVTDEQGEFSADFDIPCGPGIQFVEARATLDTERISGGTGYGSVSLPEEAKQAESATEKKVNPPKKPVHACSVGIANLLDEDLNEDITLIHNKIEYSIPPGNSVHKLTVYEEPFTLTFQAVTTEKKVLARTGGNAVSLPFINEITVDDASCGDRYVIGTETGTGTGTAS